MSLHSEWDDTRKSVSLLLTALRKGETYPLTDLTWLIIVASRQLQLVLEAESGDASNMNLTAYKPTIYAEHSKV